MTRAVLDDLHAEVGRSASLYSQVDLVDASPSVKGVLVLVVQSILKPELGRHEVCRDGCVLGPPHCPIRVPPIVRATFGTARHRMKIVPPEPGALQVLWLSRPHYDRGGRRSRSQRWRRRSRGTCRRQEDNDDQYCSGPIQLFSSRGHLPALHNTRARPTSLIAGAGPLSIDPDHRPSVRLPAI
jgi:hypothetical protein